MSTATTHHQRNPLLPGLVLFLLILIFIQYCAVHNANAQQSTPKYSLLMQDTLSSNNSNIHLYLGDKPRFKRKGNVELKTGMTIGLVGFAGIMSANYWASPKENRITEKGGYYALMAVCGASLIAVQIAIN